MFFLLPPPCIAQPSPARDANLLLLEVRLDQHVLSDGLTAYQKNRHVLLPLGELAQLLTLAIRTQPAQGTASGFVLQENRTFYLDLAQARAVLGDKTETVDPALIEVRPDDIYVASQLLAHWLPLDLEVDFSGLALKVRARARAFGNTKIRAIRVAICRTGSSIRRLSTKPSESMPAVRAARPRSTPGIPRS